jgi:hypothetical protein
MRCAALMMPAIKPPMAAVRRAQLIRGLGSAVPDKSHADPATVRVVEYALAGSAAVYRLITTITDPAQAPAADLAASTPSGGAGSAHR